MPRLFVALDLPDDVQEVLASVCNGLPGARWTTTVRFHLTLAFLGEVDGPAARQITDGLHGVRGEPFELAVRGVGHFPPRGDPRVLWAGVDPAEPVGSLRDAVHRRLRRLGAEPDARRFQAHVTLARLRQTPLDEVLAWMRRNLELRSEPFAVTHFELLESVLGREGPEYRVQERYPLFPRRGS